MSVKFNVKMTKRAMYNFMLHTSYTSISGIAGTLFGFVMLVLGIRSLTSGDDSTALTFFLFATLFIIGNPINMKLRSSEQVAKSPMFKEPITYEMTDEGVHVSQGEQSVLNEWDNFQKAVSTNTSIILYVTKVRALIFPKEDLGEQYLEVVKMISTHMPPAKVKIRHVSA